MEVGETLWLYYVGLQLMQWDLRALTRPTCTCTYLFGSGNKSVIASLTHDRSRHFATVPPGELFVDRSLWRRQQFWQDDHQHAANEPVDMYTYTFICIYTMYIHTCTYIWYMYVHVRIYIILHTYTCTYSKHTCACKHVWCTKMYVHVHV